MARLSAPRCGGLLSRIADINVTIDLGPCFSIRTWLQSKATRAAPFTQSLSARHPYQRTSIKEQIGRFLCDLGHTHSGRRIASCTCARFSVLFAHNPGEVSWNVRRQRPPSALFSPRGKRPGNLTTRGFCSFLPASGSPPLSRSTL